MAFENTKTKELLEVKSEGLFPYIGADPATSFLKNLDILNEEGFIEVNERMHTSIPGIYGAGDVIEKHLRQIVTAAGDGSIAAQEAFYYVQTVKAS